MAAVQETVDRVRSIEVDAYKYGFVSPIQSDMAPKGLNEDTVRFISEKKGEPEWLLDWRLEAFRRWQTMEEPKWARINHPPINYQEIYYFAAPKSGSAPKSPLGPSNDARVVMVRLPLASSKTEPVSSAPPDSVVPYRLPLLSMIRPACGIAPLAPVKIPSVERPTDSVTRLSSCSRERRAFLSGAARLGRLPRRAWLREFGQESQEEIAMVKLRSWMRSAKKQLRKRPRLPRHQTPRDMQQRNRAEHLPEKSRQMRVWRPLPMTGSIGFGSPRGCSVPGAVSGVSPPVACSP